MVVVVVAQGRRKKVIKIWFFWVVCKLALSFCRFAIYFLHGFMEEYSMFVVKVKVLSCFFMNLFINMGERL